MGPAQASESCFVRGMEVQSGRPVLTARPSGGVKPWFAYLPLAFFLTYLNATVALFAFGPWRYPVGDGTRVYGFLILAHLALAAGYLTVRWRAPSAIIGRGPVDRLAKVCLVVTLLLLVPTSLLNTGELLPNLVSGITDPGAVYAKSVALRSERSLVTVVAYVRVVLGPLLFLFFPLLVVYWDWLTTRVRVLGVFALAFVAATYVAMGVNKGLADMLGLFPPLALAAYLSGRLRLTRAQWVRVAAGWTLAAVLFLWFFAGTQAARTGSASEHGFLPAGIGGTTQPAGIGGKPPTTAEPTFSGGQRGISIDYGHPLLRYLPSGALRTGASGSSLYLTEGYYALYLSLNKPFVPMFGVGHSIFLTQQAIRITGNPEIGELSYPKRIEVDGWDALGSWSSIYPWLASDLSFPGTLIAIFLVGRLFALAWFDALSARNPFAYGMLAQFGIMLFYFPANNQTMQFGEGFTAFWGILALWLLTRNGWMSDRWAGPPMR